MQPRPPGKLPSLPAAVSPGRRQAPPPSKSSRPGGSLPAGGKPRERRARGSRSAGGPTHPPRAAPRRTLPGRAPPGRRRQPRGRAPTPPGMRCPWPGRSFWPARRGGVGEARGRVAGGRQGAAPEHARGRPPAAAYAFGRGSSTPHIRLPRQVRRQAPVCGRCHLEVPTERLEKTKRQRQRAHLAVPAERLDKAPPLCSRVAAAGHNAAAAASTAAWRAGHARRHRLLTDQCSVHDGHRVLSRKDGRKEQRRRTWVS